MDILIDHKLFVVEPGKMDTFLNLLDPGESALITYRGRPHDNYMVELTHGLNWIIPIEGVTPVL